ncbi:hypothetical protein MTR67_022483 [Solanum verrucosum]|uniref:F-box protein n=1 Tax=Solanum verrucosum TaxID=315347 RepID=A0AAF0QTJ7_SOLVR|nr:hypothetical protein MTR67_022483 [Solanum verrucosum]
MKLLNSPWGTSFNTKYGFGYDDSCDDYKALFIDHYHDFNNGEVYSVRIVVTIYSLRNDSWKTLHDQLQGIFLINHSDETWGSLEIPIRGEDHSNTKLGVVGSDLAVLYTCHMGLIILFNGSTKKLEHIVAVGGYNPVETYAESIVNPLTISGKNPA